jgi:diguanylate cyclase (GGDEF)-like protein/putative nucleotidyltransferase with HDIG domain
MQRARIAVAICSIVIVTGTALITGSGTNLSFTDSLLALMAFSMELAGGASMGFFFLIFSLGRHGWLDTLLLANGALVLLAFVRRETSQPVTLLRSMLATSLAAVVSQITFQLTKGPNLYVPFDLMLASTMCFVAINIFDWNRSILWTFPYYVVAAAMAAEAPPAIAQPALLFLAWCGFRIFERRLGRHKADQKRTAELNTRTIETLGMVLEARDQPFGGHSGRVAIYAAALAQELGLPEREREALRVASLLYDIGELAVPEYITLKSGSLTTEEFDKVKTHPRVGAEILEQVNFPYPVAPLVLAHHERWDGSGYPHGLAGEAIPLGARILAAVDTLDALTSPRQYRPAVPLDAAVEQVAALSGKAFDPRVVDLISKHYKQWEHRVQTRSNAGFVDSIFAAQREAQALFDLSTRLTSSLDLEDTFSALQVALRQLIPFETLAVWIERGDAICVERATGEHLALWSSLRIPAGSGVSGWVARAGEVIANAEAARELEPLGMAAEMCPFQYALAAPLQAENIRGALTLYRSAGRQFTADETRVLSVIAPKLSAAVANGFKFRRAQDQAGADPLTGLPNAAALAVHLARLEGPCAIVVCDLDGFKTVNDRFGHLTGNRLLESLAEGFRASSRNGDYVARMGGDEFVLVLNQVEPQDMQSRLDHLREMVRSVGRRILGKPILDASFGAAFYPADGATPDQLLAHADRQMYMAKSQQKPPIHALRQSLTSGPGPVNWKN